MAGDTIDKTTLIYMRIKGVRIFYIKMRNNYIIEPTDTRRARAFENAGKYYPDA